MIFSGIPKSGPLLAAGPLIDATSRERMAEDLHRAYTIDRVRFGDSERPFRGAANRIQLKAVTLHYCSYGAPAEIAFANMDGFRQFFCLSGQGRVRVAGEEFAVSPNSTGIVPPGSDFVACYGEAYAHLVVQVAARALTDQAELIFGREAPARLDLPTRQSLDAARLGRLQAIALSLALQFSADGPCNALAVAQLEQALISAFLFENLTHFSDLIRSRPPPAGQREADRLADYIQANWDRPLLVEDIAAACGMSVRSVFARFQQARGTSPMAYLRDVRLQHARRLLMDADGAGSVLDVALKCGFSSFGHFARRYRERFGELPSTTLARRSPRG